MGNVLSVCERERNDDVAVSSRKPEARYGGDAEMNWLQPTIGAAGLRLRQWSALFYPPDSDLLHGALYVAFRKKYRFLICKPKRRKVLMKKGFTEPTLSETARELQMEFERALLEEFF